MVPVEGGEPEPLPADPPPEDPVLGGGAAGGEVGSEDGLGALAAAGFEGGGPYDSPGLG